MGLIPHFQQPFYGQIIGQNSIQIIDHPVMKCECRIKMEIILQGMNTRISTGRPGKSDNFTQNQPQGLFQLSLNRMGIVLLLKTGVICSPVRYLYKIPAHILQFDPWGLLLKNR